jgi:hypothetical protein
MFETERLAPEGRHEVEVGAVDENAVNGERHPPMLAACVNQTCVDIDRAVCGVLSEPTLSPSSAR